MEKGMFTLGKECLLKWWYSIGSQKIVVLSQKELLLRKAEISGTKLTIEFVYIKYRCVSNMSFLEGRALPNVPYLAT